MVVSRALLGRGPRERPETLRRVLIAHNLLLGDTLMLTPLLAKLRHAHPRAEVTLLASPPFVPLYARRPYGVRALPFRPADSATTRALLDEPPFDLGIVVGDNRYSWLAAAMRSRQVVAHAGDRPWTKDWIVDERLPYSEVPAAWGDMVAELAPGPPPPPYRRGDWPLPQPTPFDRPAPPYAVLHVGASTPLKRWPAERWRAVAGALAARGWTPVWSAGRGEEALVRECDPEGSHASYAGRLDLPQLAELLAGAAMLVAPDTGVAHLGRVTWTPTVALFGPGSAQVCAPGHFWRDAPWRAVTEPDFPCRDQTVLFRREVTWIRRCGRSTAECAEPRCMHALGVEQVLAAVDSLRAAA